MTTLSLILLLTFSPPLDVPETGTVLFQISQVDGTAGGQISAGLFTKEHFPKTGKRSYGAEQAVDGDYLEIQIPKVPVGTYGAVAFQDIDNNLDLNTNFIGFPTEPLGFANGAKIKLGPPDFEEAAIEVRTNELTIISIILN